MADLTFFATCPKGLESLLLTELRDMGLNSLRETVAGVYFEGPLKDAYRACLWSRLANKVLLHLGRFPAANAEQLYESARAIPWQDHLRPEGTLLVDFSGTSGSIRNTQFGAVTVKDAVVDCLREYANQRPSVSKQDPDLRVAARLHKGQVALSIDLCGDSLHRRGYRQRQGAAPLKENLAAAILIRAGWPEVCERGGALIDPMCGSATLLIEAAFMALDRAPGLNRSQFACERWLQHDAEAWRELRAEARERYQQGLARDIGEIRGYDEDRDVLYAAQDNIEMAGLEEFVRVSQKSLEQLVQPTHKTLTSGLLVTNPPYGERLGEKDALSGLYRQLGDRSKEQFPGWRLAVFTGNPDLGKSLGLRAKKRYKLFNGALPSELLLTEVSEENFVNAPPKTVSDKVEESELSPGAAMLVNRLRKNQKQLSKWLKREQISCYRLYDADMPEYAAAVDVYGDYVHVQEYAAPKSIDDRKAEARFEEIKQAVPVALDVAVDNVSYKQRRRNRGSQQYERQSERHYPQVPVREGSATLMVNLWEYLDTGLFLDHRPVRRMIADMARGKRFLNLFCYTASATVHAALGGAVESVSVDMSQTYLKWAEKNFLANNMSTDKHRLEQGDCRQWLQQCRQGFDLILLDPPSFSNSKRMEGVLDIQRDQVALVDRCMELLRPGGTLIFSNNLRSFKLDESLQQRYQVTNITEQSLDPDFQRNKKIHQCWLIQQGE